jgi:hypothetical protein
MRRFGWRYGPRWHHYYVDQEIDRATVEKKAKETLASATREAPWTDPRGVKHIPLTVDGQIVGNLWEDADPKTLQVGGYWAARFGVKAELVHNSRVVGMLWLPD